METPVSLSPTAHAAIPLIDVPSGIERDAAAADKAHAGRIKTGEEEIAIPHIRRCDFALFVALDIVFTRAVFLTAAFRDAEDAI